jgi:cell division protease FtsH
MWWLLLIMKFWWSYIADIYSKDWNMYVDEIKNTKKVDLSDFVKYYKEWKFKKIVLQNDKDIYWYSFVGTWEAKTYMSVNAKIYPLKYNLYKSIKPVWTSLKNLWITLTWNTQVIVKYKEEWLLWKILVNVLPILIILWLLMFMLKWSLPKWGGPLWMMWWVWKQAKWEEVKTKFKDVAWMDEVKEEVVEVVEFLKDPKKYQKAGAKIPSWVMLYWQPWNGKTLLARAIAGEAGVPFFYSSGSEFMEMLVGMWAAKVRELFKKARDVKWPAIIFIDEIDAIGKKRGQWATWWHQEQEQTLNQILTEMDGFEKDNQIIVIAATNRLDILDPALLRPGRFDRKIYVPAPTLNERKEILKVYLKEKKLDKDLDLDKLIDSLAIRTVWFVWADIANLVNETALHAAKNDRDYLVWNDFEYSLEKVVAWPEKKIKSMAEQERKMIAYHELWHALTAHLLPYADPLEKISIVSRWMALGLTWIMPTKDRLLVPKAKFLDEIVSLMWGRASEEIFFGKDQITTWASNDMSRVYKIVYDMVTKYWMSELWPIMYFDEGQWSWQMYKPFSEKLNEQIDEQVEKFISNAYNKAKEIIIENKDIIHKLADKLLEKEYMSKEEFAKIIWKGNVEPEDIDPKKV